MNRTPSTPKLELPATHLNESDLIGDSHDVRIYHGFCKFFRERDVKPMSWDEFYRMRMAELVGSDPLGVGGDVRNYGETTVEAVDVQ